MHKLHFERSIASFVLCLTVLFTGCANLSDNTKQGVYMAGTVRLLELGHTTASEVIERVEQVRALGSEAETASYGELRLLAAQKAGFHELPLSSQMVLVTLLDDLQIEFQLTPDSPMTEPLREQIALRLRWMVQAATLYGG